jgi:hypothetical protein
MVATMVASVDQDVARAGAAHLAEGNFLESLSLARPLAS